MRLTKAAATLALSIAVFEDALADKGEQNLNGNICAGDLMALRYHSNSQFEWKRLYDNYYSYQFTAPDTFQGLPYFASYLTYFKEGKELLRVPVYVENKKDENLGFFTARHVEEHSLTLTSVFQKHGTHDAHGEHHCLVVKKVH